MTVPPDTEAVLAELRDAAAGLVSARHITDLDDALRGIVTAAVATVPGAEGGGISRTDGRRVTSHHPSTPRIAQLDTTQSQLGEGPCVDAADRPPASGVVHADDLAGPDAARWPRFAPRATRLGYRSIVSTGLAHRTGPHTALNLYAQNPHAFDDTAHAVAGLFAVQAAMLLHGAEHTAHLQRALESRDIIGRAKGVLTERFGLDDDAAFRRLVTSSQETNMKLADVARWVVEDAVARRQERGSSSA